MPVAVGELVLADVDHCHRRLVRQKEERLQRFPVVAAQMRAIQRRALLENFDGCRRCLQPSRDGRIDGRDPTALLRELLLESREVRQGELELYDRKGGERIGVARHVLVLEAAQDKTEGVHLAHTGEKPASEDIPLLATLADGGDIDDLEARIDDLAALAHFGEGVYPRIGNMGDADLGLDCRERVGCHHGIAASERIEEGRLARIGQADKADAVHDTDGTSTKATPTTFPGNCRSRSCA